LFVTCRLLARIREIVAAADGDPEVVLSVEVTGLQRLASPDHMPPRCCLGRLGLEPPPRCPAPALIGQNTRVR
jgi:hypothetical protein